MRPFMFGKLTTTLRWAGILLLFSFAFLLSSCYFFPGFDDDDDDTAPDMQDQSMMGEMMDDSLAMVAPQILSMAQAQNIIENDKDPIETTMRIQNVEPYIYENLAGKMANISAYAAKDGTSLIEVFDINDSIPIIIIYFKLDDMAEKYVKFQTFLSAVVSMGGQIEMEEARSEVADVMNRLEFVAHDSKDAPYISAGSFTLHFSSAGPSSYYRIYLRPSDNEMNHKAGDVMDGDAPIMSEDVFEDDNLPPLQ